MTTHTPRTYEPFMPLDCPHDVTIWGVSPNLRAVVSNKPVPGGMGNDSQSVAWFGGYLVCESCPVQTAQDIADLFNKVS